MIKRLKNIIVKFNIVNFLSIPLYIFRIFPIKPNQILFENFTGKGYGDSPKYIANKLLEQGDKYKLYWVINKKYKVDIPKEINVVKLYSLKYFYILATSKIWVANSRFDQYVVKRKKQYYIQTWHGGLALKKIEYDAEEKLSNYYCKVMKKDNKNIDVMISNSKFCTEMFRRGFKYMGEILEVGTPRNDVLINNKEELADKARKSLGIDFSTRILLYAPTFRSDYSKNPYNINFSALKNSLEKKTKEKWKILVKLHPRVNNSKELLNLNENALDITSYTDIQELICLCDILITDYSSTMFESMIANKSVIIYANDIESYMDERGYYFSFNDLPFPVARNNDELINIIENNELEKIKQKYEEFENRVGLIENGVASDEVCKLIQKKIND